MLFRSGKKGKGIRLEKGMTIAVEPMVLQGSSEILQLEDGWTIVTEDGSLAAHYENTILITEKEPKVLTITNRLPISFNVSFVILYILP